MTTFSHNLHTVHAMALRDHTTLGKPTAASHSTCGILGTSEKGTPGSPDIIASAGPTVHALFWISTRLLERKAAGLRKNLLKAAVNLQFNHCDF